VVVVVVVVRYASNTVSPGYAVHCQLARLLIATYYREL
jgi:hypothetical protein